MLSSKNVKNVNQLAGLSFLTNLKDSEMIPLDKSNKPPIFLNILPGVQNNPITQEEGQGGEGGERRIFMFLVLISGPEVRAHVICFPGTTFLPLMGCFVEGHFSPT